MPKRKIADAFTLIHHYYISLKDMTWKLTAYINNSDPGHSSLKQQLEKNLKIIFDSPSRKSIEKQKVKKTGMTIAKVFPLYANVIIQSGFWKHKDNNILLNHFKVSFPIIENPIRGCTLKIRVYWFLYNRNTCLNSFMAEGSIK